MSKSQTSKSTVSLTGGKLQELLDSGPFAAGVVLGRLHRQSRGDDSFNQWVRFCWAKRKKVNIKMKAAH